MADPGSIGFKNNPWELGEGPGSGGAGGWRGVRRVGSFFPVGGWSNFLSYLSRQRVLLSQQQWLLSLKSINTLRKIFSINRQFGSNSARGDGEL